MPRKAFEFLTSQISDSKWKNEDATFHCGDDKVSISLETGEENGDGVFGICGVKAISRSEDKQFCYLGCWL